MSRIEKSRFERVKLNRARLLHTDMVRKQDADALVSRVVLVLEAEAVALQAYCPYRRTLMYVLCTFLLMAGHGSRSPDTFCLHLYSLSG